MNAASSQPGNGNRSSQKIPQDACGDMHRYGRFKHGSRYLDSVNAVTVDTEHRTAPTELAPFLPGDDKPRAAVHSWQRKKSHQ